MLFLAFHYNLVTYQNKKFIQFFGNVVPKVQNAKTYLSILSKCGYFECRTQHDFPRKQPRNYPVTKSKNKQYFAFNLIKTFLY